MYSSTEQVVIEPISIKENIIKFKITLKPNQHIIRIYLNSTKKCYSQIITGDNNKLATTYQEFNDMSYQLFNPIQRVNIYERMIGKTSTENLTDKTMFLYPIRVTSGDDKETQTYFEMWSKIYKEFIYEYILTENSEINDKFKLWVEFGYKNSI